MRVRLPPPAPVPGGGGGGWGGFCQGDGRAVPGGQGARGNAPARGQAGAARFIAGQIGQVNGVVQEWWVNLRGCAEPSLLRLACKDVREQA